MTHINWSNLNKEERAKLVRFYLIDKRWSYGQLSNYLDISRNVIAGICNRHGISIVRDRTKGPIPTGIADDTVILFPLLKRPSHSREEAVKDMVKKSVAKLKAKRIAGMQTSAAHKINDRLSDMRSLPDRNTPFLTSPVWQPLEKQNPVLVEHAAFHQCRWPVSEDNRYCCGASTKEGKPYCPTHCAVAYRPAPPLRLKKKHVQKTQAA